MKIEHVLKKAMTANGIKNAAQLALASKKPYATINRALNGDNVGIVVVVELLEYLGYQLKAELIK